MKRRSVEQRNMKEEKRESTGKFKIILKGAKIYIEKVKFKQE